MRGGFIGSEEHKRLLCRTFIDTHQIFDPTCIAWPDLEDQALARLKALPVWTEAARTEAETALKVQTLGREEPDPLLAEAIRLQGYEEGRHASIIRALIERYGIAVPGFDLPPPPKDAAWTFMSVGYGECIDSFFAFGLFEIGRRSSYFPSALTDIFEPIVQEEARHILFLVNWAAYRRKQASPLARPLFDARRALVIGRQLFERARQAATFGGKGSEAGFEMTSHSAFEDITARRFFELCLSENDRRLAVYDPRLLRPTLVPRTVRLVLSFLPGPGGGAASRAAHP